MSITRIPLDYSISEREYNEIAHAIRNHPYDFDVRPDIDVKVSLSHYGWIAHKSGDYWTLIVRCSRRQGGPGFRIIVIERSDMKSWYEDNWEDTHFGNKHYGYNHFTKMWNDESDSLLFKTYVKNNDSLRLPSHLKDNPWKGGELADILKESSDSLK